MNKWTGMFSKNPYWITASAIFLLIAWAAWDTEPTKGRLIVDAIFSSLLWTTLGGTVIFLIKKYSRRNK